MEILTIILRGFLNLTNHVFVFPFLVILFYTYSSAISSRVILIFLFSMLLNAILKYYFHVPLPPHLAPGWAFPSGHMHAAMALWGWLAWEINRKWFYALVSLILTGIGIGLVYFGYHSVADVCGAVFFCLLIFIAYHFLLAKYPLPQASLGLFFSVIGAVIIYIIPLSFPHLWLACGALLGFAIGRLCYPQNFETDSTNTKLIFSMTALACSWGLSLLVPQIGIAKTQQSFLMSLLLTLSFTFFIPQLLKRLPSLQRMK